MKRRHDGRHGEDCFGCRIHHVAFASSHPAVRHMDATEKRWAKDFAAYRTLRAQGVQPVHADGCDLLATVANTREEIEGQPEPFFE